MFENLKYDLWAHVKDIFSTVNFFENSFGYLSECDIKNCETSTAFIVFILNH